MTGPPIDEHRFGSSADFTLGVEEELFLVDPLTGEQVQTAVAVLEQLEIDGGRVERELHASQVELITDVHTTTGEAVAQISALRGAVRATGAAVLGAGMHPAAAEGQAQVTDRERYARIRELLGDAVADPTSGLHIHVGMPDAGTAIRAFNGLRAHLPLLQALGANSPFHHGRDSGLASVREITMRGWPRSGVPRQMRDFDDFVEAADRLSRAADVADYTWFWWKLRPHPRLGTVEVRALDAQTELDDLAPLVALTHCLAVHAATGEQDDGPPLEILDEAGFRAARYGATAQLPDRDGKLRPVEQILQDLLPTLTPIARDLSCADELQATRGLLERGGGAARQRATHDLVGMGGLLRNLRERTAP